MNAQEIIEKDHEKIKEAGRKVWRALKQKDHFALLGPLPPFPPDMTYAGKDEPWVQRTCLAVGEIIQILAHDLLSHKGKNKPFADLEYHAVVSRDGIAVYPSLTFTPQPSITRQFLACRISDVGYIEYSVASHIWDAFVLRVDGGEIKAWDLPGLSIEHCIPKKITLEKFSKQPKKDDKQESFVKLIRELKDIAERADKAAMALGLDSLTADGQAQEAYENQLKVESHLKRAESLIESFLAWYDAGEELREKGRPTSDNYDDIDRKWKHLHEAVRIYKTSSDLEKK